MLTSEIRFAVVDPEGGDIIRTGACSQQSLALQGQDGMLLIYPVAEGVQDDTHYWAGQVFAPYPVPQPSPYHRWNGGAWIDPRTPEQLEAELVADLQSRRAAASLTRLEFVRRVSHPETGVISPASGMGLLDGVMPPELAGLVSSMTLSAQFDLLMDLKGASQFDRLNPLVIAAGQYLGLTDEQMDAVFGI